MKKIRYYMVGMLMLVLMIPTVCHAQETETQTIRIEATIGDWGTSSDNKGDTGETTPSNGEQNVTIPPSKKDSSSNFPRTGELFNNQIALIGLLVSLLALVMIFVTNREKDFSQNYN
ncbi:hypothetical protein A5844_000310 [Enterococcus sp. 10A9_DIV0425]|uniref:Gram-positive cocci surface proteins LPxTG domain-containing protein n=1 Tax=Candidatus Enterococcus wittei TaxID=1987383 RepID=A0A2C9XRR0_9ENTE|nr:LPXTG cell wall anchor domain-containing protein [Enterococcus sp. 10A9_DIV0425]OTP12094.1 hypothetical protein A5844_000310 [Enterococcus sp. 10A9_DIV0425]